MNPVIISIFKVIITCQEDDEEEVLTNEEYDKLKRVIYETFIQAQLEKRADSTDTSVLFFATGQASTVFCTSL